MKKIKYIFSIGLMFLSACFTSCSDWFDIYPKSETILEDYWKNEGDVLSMVAACYRAMNEPGFMERTVVWGEVRSDDVIKGSDPSDDINRILQANLDASNEYTSWGDFYKVINYCNTVMLYAPGVRDKDPNFTEDQLHHYIAEVKGIRALCYFILVRSFRDVPFITDPYVDDTRSFEIAQTSPDQIIDFLISDLKGIEEYAATGWDNVNTRYTKGRITKNAIRALIADMALWRNDYQTCITYCDKILNDPQFILQLENSNVYNANVFYDGNSKESIFELQFYTSNISNYAVFELYGKGGGRADKKANQLAAIDFSKQTLFGTTDLRSKDAFFPNTNGSFFPIEKYVAVRIQTGSTTVRESDYQYNYSTPNWIFYRLPDIYLMKAEALVETGSDLESAFDLVCKTYYRANPDLSNGALQFSDFNSQQLMRDLVLDERQREFLFEGKRYYDLLRRINREGTAINVVNAYLMKKYTGMDATTIRSKLSDINALYMPINSDELKLNPLLIQNPFYTLSVDVNKN